MSTPYAAGSPVPPALEAAADPCVIPSITWTVDVVVYDTRDGGYHVYPADGPVGRPLVRREYADPTRATAIIGPPVAYIDQPLPAVAPTAFRQYQLAPEGYVMLNPNGLRMEDLQARLDEELARAMAGVTDFDDAAAEAARANSAAETTVAAD